MTKSGKLSPKYCKMCHRKRDKKKLKLSKIVQNDQNQNKYQNVTKKEQRKGN